MPELPEVENIRRSLEKRLVGKRILGCVEHFPGVLVGDITTLSSTFPVEIRHLHRHGKILSMDLGRSRQLVVHFRMTGTFYFRNVDDPLRPHTHIEFSLDSGELMAYRDPRRFGRLWLVSEASRHPAASLGPDALIISEQEFVSRISTRCRMIKPLLMDQSVVAGLGNIYADEALFLAGIHPLALSGRLSKRRLSELWRASRRVLERAIETGGSSIQDFISPDGVYGRFQDEHAVYDRAGKPCPRCGTILKRIVVRQRGTCFCPRCQRRR